MSRLGALVARKLSSMAWFRRGLKAGVVLERMAALPFGDLDELSGGAPVLVLAPHPDDESLGCGGLIAAACARGVPPVVAVLTDGCGSHPGSSSHPPARLAALRQAEARAAMDALGLPAGRLHFLGLPDGRAPQGGQEMQAAAERLADLAAAAGARTLVTTWEHDPHPDHVAAHAIAREAAQRLGARLLRYSVWGWMLPSGARLPVEELAGLRLDIAAHLPAKRRAIAAHASQHGIVVTDDPAGFALPATLLRLMDRPFECYLCDR